MRDNLSIVITMLIFVILIVIFPLYNYFERQDDMSYNLALKTTTNFVDQVLESGYLDQQMYDNYVNELGSTGNTYEIELEAHRKLIVQNKDSLNTYDEQYIINYNNDIFEEISDPKNINDKKLKNDIYYFNEGDQFYVKMKNSNTTMAGAIFNTIVPTASKDRIVVNYGGVIKNQAWDKVDATFRDALSVSDNAPEFFSDQQTSWGIAATDSLSEQGKVTVSSGKVSGNITFYATGPDNFSKNWFGNNVDKYEWKLVNTNSGAVIGSGLLDKSQKFKVSALQSDNTYKLTVSGYDSVNSMYTNESSVLIEVKKKVKTILAGVGWSKKGDIDLSFYFSKENSTSLTRIDYRNKSTTYGTITNDDTSGGTNITSDFKKKLPSSITLSSSARINEYILITDDSNNFKNMVKDKVNSIDVYINCFSNGSTFSDFYNDSLYAVLVVIYEDNSAEKIEMTKTNFNKFKSSKTIKMTTLIRVGDDWMVDEKDAVASSLPS